MKHPVRVCNSVVRQVMSQGYYNKGRDVHFLLTRVRLDHYERTLLNKGLVRSAFTTDFLIGWSVQNVDLCLYLHSFIDFWRQPCRFFGWSIQNAFSYIKDEAHVKHLRKYSQVTVIICMCVCYWSRFKVLDRTQKTRTKTLNPLTEPPFGTTQTHPNTH